MSATETNTYLIMLPNCLFSTVLSSFHCGAKLPSFHYGAKLSSFHYGDYDCDDDDVNDSLRLADSSSYP